MFFTMLWINVDYPTGLWKLHEDSCRFCDPVETLNKGVNEFKDHGAWVSFKSYSDAKDYFDENSRDGSIWQPCKVCDPGDYYKNREKSKDT